MQALGLTNLTYEAKQSAVARYNAVGFEAAAVTALALSASAPRLRPGQRREATLRFGHPFAVVAVAYDDQRVPTHDSVQNPWHGLPVFSAWVGHVTDAESTQAPQPS
jgi:hypothetical protein